MTMAELRNDREAEGLIACDRKSLVNLGRAQRAKGSRPPPPRGMARA